MSANYDFKGRTILVTGAGAGIGKTICKKLIASNAKVIGVSLIQEELDVLKEELPDIRTIQVDLRDWKATRKAIEGVLPVHGLVNNAGVLYYVPFFEVTEEHFDLTYSVNVKAVLNVSQVVAKSMIDNKIQGCIVNISSVAAIGSGTNVTIYGSSKAAVQMLTKNMAQELGPHRIRVTSVNPSLVKTDMTRFYSGELEKRSLQRTPLGRLTEKEDVAAAVLFLLSDESSMVTGSPILLDGGSMK